MDAFLQKRSRLGGVEPHPGVERSREDGILTTCSEEFPRREGFWWVPLGRQNHKGLSKRRNSTEPPKIGEEIPLGCECSETLEFCGLKIEPRQVS